MRHHVVHDTVVGLEIVEDHETVTDILRHLVRTEADAKLPLERDLEKKKVTGRKGRKTKKEKGKRKKRKRKRVTRI